MRTIAVLGTAALFAATPASILLIGSATFSEEVPVRVPSTAILLDSHGRTVGTGRPVAQKGAHPGAGADRTGAARPSPSARATPDDHGSSVGLLGRRRRRRVLGPRLVGSGVSGHGGDDGGGSGNSGTGSSSSGSGSSGSDDGGHHGGDERWRRQQRGRWRAWRFGLRGLRLGRQQRPRIRIRVRLGVEWLGFGRLWFGRLGVEWLGIRLRLERLGVRVRLVRWRRRLRRRARRG